jgi:wobble nucleotide-excising tRNase
VIVRLTNGPLARMLHFALYERMLDFCTKVNPEIPGEAIVEAWLDRLYRDDPRLHILVNLDEQYHIVEHAVIDIQQVGSVQAVVCHQVFRDRPNLETFKQGLEYIDNLRRSTGAVCSAIYVQKHVKALERAGYKTAQVLMIKCSYDAEETTQDAQLEASANGVQALPQTLPYSNAQI